LIVREARISDEAGWRRLWAGYLVFYETTVPDDITDLTWRRILDPAVPMIGRIAEQDGAIAGFSVSVVHVGTWYAGPACYLEDLFVDPACRGQGIGRALVQDLVDQGRHHGWANLYWHTQHNNPARKLYDAFVGADETVRYRLTL